MKNKVIIAITGLAVAGFYIGAAGMDNPNKVVPALIMFASLGWILAFSKANFEQ